MTDPAAIYPLIALAACLALIPVANKMAQGLAQSLNAEWADSAREWAAQADLTAEAQDAFQTGQTPDVSDPGRGAVLGIGSVAAILTAGYLYLSQADAVVVMANVALTFGLLVAVLVDLRIQMLPDVVLWPLAGLGALLSVMGFGVAPETALIGALAGGGSLWLLAFGFYMLRGTGGLGQGDIKLVGMAGLWLGWMPLPWMLMAAALGAIVLHLLLYRGDTRARMAFGPALALGFWAVRFVPMLMP